MFFEEYEIGQSWSVSPIVISKEQIIEFAKTYDPVPFHLNEDYAESTRFGRLISSGAMNFLLLWAGFIRQLDFSEEGLVAGRGHTLLFEAPVYAGDALHATATVVRLEQRNPHNGAVVVKVEGFNQDGVNVLNAESTIVLKLKGPTS